MIEKSWNLKMHFCLLFVPDVGRLKEMSTKKQKFKATISMADSYPLSLQQQVLPIIKLLVSINLDWGGECNV